MAFLKISGGSSTENSVAFFPQKSITGIKAIRQKDGSIITEEVNLNTVIKQIIKLLLILIIIFIFKEIAYIFNFPLWLYNIPTVLWVIFYVYELILELTKPELRRHHGAEHKVYHWYYKKNKDPDIMKSIKKCSRIHFNCGTNLMGTIVTFQLISSICFSCFNIHIPELITSIMPFFVPNIFPFNILGLLSQLITTANPKDEHIQVALKALEELLKTN